MKVESLKSFTLGILKIILVYVCICTLVFAGDRAGVLDVSWMHVRDRRQPKVLVLTFFLVWDSLLLFTAGYAKLAEHCAFHLAVGIQCMTFRPVLPGFWGFELSFLFTLYWKWILLSCNTPHPDHSFLSFLSSQLALTCLLLQIHPALLFPFKE